MNCWPPTDFNSSGHIPLELPPALSCPPLNAACNPCCCVLPTLSPPGRCRKSLPLTHGSQIGQKCLGAYSIPRGSPQAADTGYNSPSRWQHYVIFSDTTSYTKAVVFPDTNQLSNTKWVLLLFSGSVVSSSLQPPELQYTRLLCPSLSPQVCSNSCPLSE